jgi:ankyrin repeat protein
MGCGILRDRSTIQGILIDERGAVRSVLQEDWDMVFSRRNLLYALPAAVLGMAGVSNARWRLPSSLGAAPFDRAQEFLSAVKAGAEAQVRSLLLEQPALASTRDAAGLSALLHAHLAGHPGIAKLLEQSGLELDIVECVFQADWARMEALAKARPELANALHPIGGNLLYAGALAGTNELWRIRSLGSLRDAAPAGGSGFTPARGAMEQRTFSGALISATDLLSNGSSPNSRQRGCDSVLHGAVRRREERLVRLAVRKGCDVEARDDAGRTALELARELDWGVGALLLESQADLPRDHRASRFLCDANRKPLQRIELPDVPQALQNEVTGSSHSNLKKLSALVKTDPRLIFSISTDDELAIEASAHIGNHELMRFHLDHGAPFSLPTAASLADAAMLRYLLDSDPLLIHERGAHDFAPMHYAALGRGDVEIAALLHERGAAIDQESQGLTALHWSVRRDRPDLTVWLIEHGADLQALSYKWDERGQTPLQVALAFKQAGQAKILRDAGAR